MRFPLFGRKGREARPELARYPVAGAAWFSGERPRGYEAMVRAGFIENPIAQRAVRTVAEGAGSVGFVVPQGHALGALMARPAPGMSGAEFVEAVAAYLLLHGNAYVEVVEGADGLPLEMYALRPDRVSVEVDGGGWPAAHVYRAGAAVTRYPVTEDGRAGLLHVRTFHPLDDHYGLGSLGAAAGAVETHNAASRWNTSLLDNAARPSGALVYDAGDGGTLSAEQFDRLKAEMEASFAGAANAGRPMLLEGGLRWQALSLTPAELDFVGAKAAAAREIALAFGVPPMLLGLPGDSSYANYAEANRALWRLTLLPLVEKLAGAFAAHFRHWWPEVSVGIDRDSVPALAADRERLWKQVAGADFLSRDEKRAMLGLRAEEA